MVSEAEMQCVMWVVFNKQAGILQFIHSFIHSVVCLMAGS